MKTRRHIFQSKPVSMKRLHQIPLLFLVIFFSAPLFGQDAGNRQTAKPEFKLGIYYNTNLNYYGRVDSLKSSGIFPLAELWFNKSFYINAAPIFVNNNVKSLDYAGAVATVGYRYTSDSKKFGSHIYFVKPFYKPNSQLVQSALKAQAAFTLTWYNKVLNFTGGADVKFSNRTDFGTTSGVDHIIKSQLDKKTVLVFDPSFYMNAGSQRFTESYYQNTGIPGINQLVTKSTDRFSILSYEASMPIVLGLGKLQLLAIPAYVFPQNLISVPGRPDLSERGENLFYATLGVKYNF